MNISGNSNIAPLKKRGNHYPLSRNRTLTQRMNARKLLKFSISLGVAVWLLLISQWGLAAQIQTSVDRNPVSIDESFQITFTADDTPDDDPDFGPLEEDFDILNQSHASNSSWINGKASKSIQWILNVMAKQPGTLTIPAIRFGNDTSDAITVKVVQGTVKPELDTEDELYLEVEASPSDPYVQSQVIYTMRLYVRVNIAQASLSEPEIADAVVEKLAEDSKYTTQIKGAEYSVIERKYAIFPQKSGTLTIKPLTLTAEVVTNSRPSFNGFFNSQVTRTKQIKSKAVSLNVKPMPAVFNGKHWLSGSEVVLKEEWSGDTQQVKVGEPLTRTLSLKAVGATVGQLPELNNTKTDDRIKTYPDQPVLQELKKPEGVSASREEKIALILSRPGTYTLPAVRIPWFNTHTQKLETATLPETTITAVGAAGASAEPLAPTPAEPVAPVKSSPQKAPVTPAIQPATNGFWIALSAALGLGWLATLSYFLSKRNTPKAIVENPVEAKPDVSRLEKDLKDACTANHPDNAKNALLAWGRQLFNTTSLEATARHCDARLRDEILELSKALYSKDKTQWQGKKLLQVFTEQKAQQRIINKETSELQPLHRL